MCAAVVAQFILDALVARIKNLSVFTSFDVTSDARDLTDERVSHRDVRNIVHQEFMTGQFPADYNQEAIELDVPNNPVAIVYYPDGKQASDHPKALHKTIPTQPPVSVTSPVSQAVASVAPQSRLGGSTKDGDDYICKATAEGRINLPKDLCEKVVNVGGTVDIAVNGSMLYKKPNSDGRVRVNTAELGGDNEYRVSVDTKAGTIVITKK